MTNFKLTNRTLLTIFRTTAQNAEAPLSKDCTNEEILAKIDKMIEALDQKKETTAMTENQKQNEGFKVDILATLANGARLTASEVWKQTPSLKACEAMTNQRVSAILRQMVLGGTVDKVVEKGKTLFYAV